MYRIVLFGGCQRRRAAGGWNLDVGVEREEWRGAGLSLLSFGSCVVLNRARALAQVFYQPSSGDVNKCSPFRRHFRRSGAISAVQAPVAPKGVGWRRFVAVVAEA